MRQWRSFTSRQQRSRRKVTDENLRLKSSQDAEIGYPALQWLYNLDIKPTIPGIQNMARFLALTDPKVKSVKNEDVVDEGPWQRLEKSAYYRELLSTWKR
ncbi:MAG TPA: hypothetical protein VHM64_04695 [Candidatus Binatia bacterium]|nr:hypothetical protein [Candidatus Binatia bacterium]